MSLHHQNTTRSRFNPYFQSSNSNSENPTGAAQTRLLKERVAGGNVGLYENSFINKTYHHVRSFGRDLSNIQSYQDSKQPYGEQTQNISHQQPKILRVKSQIGTANQANHR